MNNHALFGYYITRDDRERFDAEVRDEGGKVVYEIKGAKPLESDATGFFYDGWIQGKHAVGAIQTRLKELRLIPADAEVLSAAQFEQVLAARPSQERSVADDLTIAYMAIGAKTILQQPQHLHSPRTRGELEYVSDVIKHALLLDRLADGREENFSGVFLYEAAEPFGEFIATCLMDGTPITDELLKATGEELIQSISITSTPIPGA